MAVAPVGPHKVRRPFLIGDRRVGPGDIVDVTGWRNAYQLVDRGYLVAINDRASVDVAPVAKKAPAKKRAAKKPAAKKSTAED